MYIHTHTLRSSKGIATCCYVGLRKVTKEDVVFNLDLLMDLYDAFTVQLMDYHFQVHNKLYRVIQVSKKAMMFEYK